jgi:hypothetical protein
MYYCMNQPVPVTLKRKNNQQLKLKVIPGFS